MTNPIKKATIYGIISILLALIIASSAFADSGFCTSGETGNVSITSVELYSDYEVPQNQPFTIDSDGRLFVTFTAINSGDHSINSIAQTAIYSNKTGQLISHAQTPVFVINSMESVSFTLIIDIPLNQDILTNTDYSLYVNLYNSESIDIECAEYPVELRIEYYSHLHNLLTLFFEPRIANSGQDIKAWLEVRNYFDFPLNNISINISDSILGIDYTNFIGMINPHENEVYEFDIHIPEDIHNSTLSIYPEITLDGTYKGRGYARHFTVTDINLSEYVISGNINTLIASNNIYMMYSNAEYDMVEEGIDNQVILSYYDEQEPEYARMNLFKFINQTAVDVWFDNIIDDYSYNPDEHASNITVANQIIISFNISDMTTEILWKSNNYVITIIGVNDSVFQVAAAYLALYPSDFTTAHQPVGN